MANDFRLYEATDDGPRHTIGGTDPDELDPKKLTDACEHSKVLKIY